MYNYDIETNVIVRTNVKVLYTIFFDCHGVVHHEFLSQDRTANEEFYVEVMSRLSETVRPKRTELWKNQLWILLHDNACAGIFGEKQNRNHVYIGLGPR